MIFASACLLLAGCGADVASTRFQPAPGSPFRIGEGVSRPALGDVNRDGHIDVVLGYGTGSGASFVVLLGDGKGGFTKGHPCAAEGAPDIVPALGDLDEDGTLDLVGVSHDRDDLWKLRGNGQGGFQAFPGKRYLMKQSGRHHTHDVVVNDINGDSHLDVLTTNADDNAVSLGLGNGKGGFALAPGSPFPAGNHPYSGLSLADLNGDKALDIVVPNVHGNAVSALLGNGKGLFKLAGGAPWPVGPRPSVTSVADVNGDGKPDIVATHDDDALLAVLIGDGKGGFKNAPGSPYALPQRAWGIACGDLNADGKIDLLLGSPTSELLLVLGDGTGAFGKRFEKIPVGTAGPFYALLADVNHDGKLDIVTSNGDSGSVSVLLCK
jgi:hypothetical protein